MNGRRPQLARGLAIVSCAFMAVPAVAGDAASMPPVEEDYVLHCSACHGLDGAGASDVVPGLGGVGDVALRPGGRDYLMRVPGAAQSPVDDARLARLLNWVIEEFGGVELESPLTEHEVGRARRAPLRDPGSARRALLADPPPAS